MWGLPIDASADGYQIDRVILFVHILMLVLFVGWGIFYVYTLMRFRRSKNPKADYHGAKTHASSYAEAGVAVIEALLLIGLSIPIYNNFIGSPQETNDQTVTVRVVAQQFAWNIHYPGPDGKFGRTSPKLISAINSIGLDIKNDPHAADDIVSTTGDLTVPNDQKIVLKISSKDVIHSLGLPNFRVKLDAIPGMVTSLSFHPKKLGSYNIVCSQLCGVLHTAMKGKVHVKTLDDFTKWHKTAQSFKDYIEEMEEFGL